MSDDLPNKSSQPSPEDPVADRICPECEERVVEEICPKCKVSTIPASVLEEKEDPLVGQTLQDKYRIDGILGQGGMGTVYRGTQLTIDRAVAIKVVSREFSNDLESIKRFQREAKITSKLSHTNTIRLYDFGLTEGGQLFLVMELLKGHELADELESGKGIPLGRAISICLQVLRALREAHNLDIVHRDLKPANIFLQETTTGEDLVKVMDFGIAKTIDDDEVSKVTKTGMLVGTPAYMSPEQARGDHVGAQSDLYAVGMIFYELLAGRVAFEGETPVATLLAQLTQAPPPITRFRRDLPNPDAIQEVINQFLAKRSDQRPKDASAAMVLLEELTKEGGASLIEERDEATVMIQAMSDDTPPPAQRAPSSAHLTTRQVSQAPQEASAAPKGATPPSSDASAQSPAPSSTSVAPSLGTSDSALPAPKRGKGAGLTIAAVIVLIGAVGIYVALSGAGEEPAAAARDKIAPIEMPQPPQNDAKKIAASTNTETKKEAPPPSAPAPQEVQAVKPPAAPAEKKTIRIVSVPVTASVFAGGALLGATPLSLDSPDKGNKLILELKAVGYKPQTFTIEGDESGERSLTLEKLTPTPKVAAKPAASPRKKRKKKKKKKAPTSDFMLD